MSELPIKVTLARPIRDGEAEISELVFDEPDVAADLAWLELLDGIGTSFTRADGMRASLFWWSRLSGVPEAAMTQIKARDQEAVAEAVERVFAAIGRDLPDGDEADEEGAEGNAPGA